MKEPIKKDTLIRRQVFLDDFVDFPLHYGGWAISEDYAYDLVQTAFYFQPKVMVDLGGGTSTILMAKVAQELDEKEITMEVFSVDHEKMWQESTRKIAKILGLEKYIRFILAPIQEQKVFGKYYDLKVIKKSLKEKKIELISIDGPPGVTQKEARYPAMPGLKNFFSQETIVMLDDGIREEEKSIVERWKKDFPNWYFEYRQYMKGGFVGYHKDSQKGLISTIGNHKNYFDFNEASLVDVQKSLENITTQLAQKEQKNQELAAQLTQKEQKNQELAAQLTQREQKNQELATGIKKKNEKIDKILYMLEKNKIDLYNLKNSKSFRLGNLFFRSLKNPWKMMTFPMNSFYIIKPKKEVLPHSCKKNKVAKKNKSISRAASKGVIKNDFKKNEVEELIERIINLSQKENNFKFPSHAEKDIKKLKVAAIMDEFTYTSFRYECNIKQLTPDNWKREIKEFQPDMLFVESAWRGKDDLWRNLIVKQEDKTLFEIVKFCKENGIPTAFWSKEDPVHFDNFIKTAQVFDFIFTTDKDCVSKYKEICKNDKVFVLPFACQPKVTNPIETYNREDAFVFAGSYYHRYPERIKKFDNLFEVVSSFRKFDIYDRNFGKENKMVEYPEKYKKNIVGSLSFFHIDKAHKGYNYALNMTTVTKSPTMFARRVFELLASNTLVISNYSLGIESFFGELVINTDNKDELESRLQEILNDESLQRKIKLQGLREVLKKHTYRDRLLEIFASVFEDFKREDCGNLSYVGVIAKPKNQKELLSILEGYKRQSYPKKKLFVIKEDEIKLSCDKEGVVFFSPKDIQDKDINSIFSKEVKYISFFHAEDYYGKHYLEDLLLSTSYSNADCIGKNSYYYEEGGVILKKEGLEYCEQKNIFSRTGIFKKEFLKNIKSILVFTEDAFFFDGENYHTLSTDCFNYCMSGSENKGCARIEF